MKTYLSVALTIALLALVPASAFAVLETEPNDSKAQANAIPLPAVNTLAAITGNSTSAATTGLDYFRVTTAVQATPGFYRHRLICTSTIVGHTVTIRGLTQVAGVPQVGTDAAFQTSATTTTPPRTIQWYTSQASSDMYVRVTGVAATTADYNLDYEVQPVTPIAGPTGITPGSITITTVGQTTVDTDLWVYDSARVAIPTYGNDDHFMGTTLQSELIRTYAAGTYYLSISNFQWANNLPAPPDDDFQTGQLMDFPGPIANSSTTANAILNPMIGGTAVPATKPAFFDVVFVSFGVGAPTCNEVEPNDAKGTATPCTLPATNQTAAITGNSTSAAGAGIDTYRLTTAVQATPGFYRHRLIIQSTTVGHTGTLRGLSQLNGVINPTSDIAMQTSATTTTPPRFVQWYTDGGAREIFVRVTGVAATTANYTLDYEVQQVTEVAGPTNSPMGLTITSEGQTTVDTDLWLYDLNRAAIVDAGNDDTFGGTTLQSTLTRTLVPGVYHLAISSFNLGNNLASPVDDDFRNGNVLDFTGNLANDLVTLNQDVDVTIGGVPVTLLKTGAFDVVFASFTVIVPVELLDFKIE